MDKEDVAYKIEWNSLSYKKEYFFFSFTATWMDLEGIMLGEIMQREKYKYCMTLYRKFK